jgi:hypothetical protein
MRIANPFFMITHVIGSLHEADVGWQSADTIKLNFRFWARAGKLRLTSMSRHRPHDRLRPKSAIETHAPQQLPALFDHLVGAQQERFRYREAPPWRLCD